MGSAACYEGGCLCGAIRYVSSADEVDAGYSSTHGQREYCSMCGTQIAYRDSCDATTVDVNVGSLDKSDQIRPRCHIWFKSRIDWFDTDDDLPRYDEEKPQDSAP